MTEGSSSVGESEMPHIHRRKRGWIELPKFLQALDETPDLKRGVSIRDLLSGDGPYDPSSIEVPPKDSQAVLLDNAPASTQDPHA